FQVEGKNDDANDGHIELTYVVEDDIVCDRRHVREGSGTNGRFKLYGDKVFYLVHDCIAFRNAVERKQGDAKRSVRSGALLDCFTGHFEFFKKEQVFLDCRADVKTPIDSSLLCMKYKM